MSTVRPLSPDEMLAARKEAIPDEVFSIFNDLLAQHYNGSYAHITQSAVVARLIEAGFARDTIFSKQWLDIEQLYREAGWKVVYDKPGYNESYDPVFKFSKK